MANSEAWAQGVDIGKRNMEQAHKMGKSMGGGAGGMMGSKKKGGKIKKTGRYKLHEGEEEVRGGKRVRKIKKTGVRHLQKGERIIPKNKVKKHHRKASRKRG